ncbi:MAG: T9SS type A sorting domain-containing protein, partial [Candidatus Eisenbacteria bacterium]|nr:T9SS type A sorting domain-containing protein [Candidatus Eisenbacteria bacterium]
MRRTILAGPLVFVSLIGLILASLEGPHRASPRTLVTAARPVAGDGPGADSPAPTEVVRWKEERREHRRQREAWLESLHRCPPDLDWREIEAANRRALALERYARIEGGDRTEGWTELGSVNLAGRTHAACPGPDEQTLYVGSNLGGVWRGAIDGQSWEPIADGLGIGSNQLCVAPAGGPGEPEVVLTLTTPGPGSASGSGTLHATTDAGATWFVPAGIPEDLYEALRIVRDRAEPRTVYLLSRARQWINETEFVYGFLVSRSTDGGQTFSLQYLFDPPARCDMWIDRVNGGPLYVLSGTTLHVSHDGAGTFQEVGTISAPSVTDVQLTASEAGSPAFYAALKTNNQWKLYRSTNGGADWAYRHDIHDFWKTLVASITDPQLVLFAGVECWRSADGGNSFNKINNWYDYYGDPEHRLHADLPGMDVHMVNGQEAIYFNTDGGTYVSYDGGLNLQNLSLWGLAVSQYYSTLTSMTDPYLVAAGSQDQGYQQSLQGRGAFLELEQLISGDYGHLTSTVRDHNWLYSVYPGFVLLQKNETAPQYLFQIDFPPCEHSWMPAITADPYDSDILYFCGDHLWRYERQDPGYTYAMTELPQDFSSGGYLTGLAISPADTDYRYAVTSTGILWFSHDAGATWTESVHGPSAHYFYGTALVASPGDRDLAYAGGSGYEGQPVWRTTDGGVTWHGYSDGLPNTLVLGLALGDASGETPYAAAESGPFRLNPQSGQWESILGTEAPLTRYWCVEWVPEAGAARFGTYGRGIWDYTPPAAADIAEGAAAPIGFACYPNPAHRALSARFRLTESGPAALELFDIAGRRVARTAMQNLPAGEQTLELTLDARLAGGTYLARLATDGGSTVRKVQVV